MNDAVTNPNERGINIPTVPVDATYARRRHAAEIARQWLGVGTHYGIPPVVIDTETTGLDNDAEVCEIAAVDIYGNVLINTLVRPSVNMPQDAMDIHGITDDDLVDAPSFSKVLPSLHLSTVGRLLLSYNAQFDRRVLAQSCRGSDLFKSFGGAQWRCIMQLYAYWWGEYDFSRGAYRWQRLQTAAERHDLFRLEKGAAHRALSDARLALTLLRFMADD